MTDPDVLIVRRLLQAGDGFVSGIKTAMTMQGIGLGLLKAKRLNPMELVGGHKLKDLKGFHAIIAKASEIEDRKKGFTRG